MVKRENVQKSIESHPRYSLFGGDNLRSKRATGGPPSLVACYYSTSTCGPCGWLLGRSGLGLGCTPLVRGIMSTQMVGVTGGPVEGAALNAAEASGLRYDWSRDEVAKIYTTPLTELVFRAQTVHR